MQRFSPGKMASRRRRMGKTQTVLAGEAGLSQASVSALERGKKEPRASTLLRVAGVLRCGVEDLLEWEGRDETA
ncbi:MAG: helix-turn-helix transcriptional regulator [Nitrospirota bacterium]|jgi:transcriptional regulator with XRE-family HTH domain